MASYTEHYGLHQWEPEDPFLRTDFNTDFLKIDTALGEKDESVLGVYIGDGTESREITLGFQPRALYLCSQGGLFGAEEGMYKVYGGMAMPGHPVVDQGHNNEVAVEITATGFQVHQEATYRKVNTSGWTYHYHALR